MNIAIIGGGAAGFFAAINIMELSPNENIVIFEKNRNVLSKLAISGGGRCNVTNSFEDITDFAKAYPRGDKLIKRGFKVFSHLDAYKWFEQRGVSLITQEDRCVFPRSQNSQSIIDCFLNLAAKYNITVNRGEELLALERQEKGFAATFNSGTMLFDRVVVATGGSTKRDSFDYLEKLGHKIVTPIPSLFTFNTPNNTIRELMGVVVENATVSLQGTKLKSSGALLITHWGLSGPAVLKLSSYAAPLLKEHDYRFNILVNWVGESNFDSVAATMNKAIADNSQKQISNIRPYNLTARLWLFLLQKAEIAEDRRCGELGKKSVNKLVNILTNDEISVCGRGAFRDEFVTCGGVSLDSINYNTMESKCCEGLYFAGEVLDIDAITGGFNFQAAWTTGFLVAQNITLSSSKH